jgi:hypothetical protein
LDAIRGDYKLASVTETNTYSPSISKVDPNNDIANQQLANRTLYLKTALDTLQNYVNTFKTDTTKDVNDVQRTIKTLQEEIDKFNSTSSAMDEKKIISELDSLTTAVTALQSSMLSHTHNYAGSAKPSGDASTVDIVEDSISKNFLIGTNALTANKIRRNSNISMENGALSAQEFIGGLTGTADSAKKLYYKPKITLSGDVVGSIDFEGDKDIIINTSIKEQSVSPGEYGAVGNYTLSSTGSFTVPDITVNTLGIITKIRNRTITLPNNMGINGITSSKNTDKKIFVLGASEQAEKSSVYSQNGVYIDEHNLYSNDKEVVNLSDFQSLTNKTYEGYELAEACSRGVDEKVGGTKDDNRLVTSNSLARHKHNYAISDSVDGKSLYVNISVDNTNKTFLVNNNDEQGKLTKNTNIYVKGKGLFSEDLTATENMYIPGGKIWIDSVEVPIDDNAWSGKADIAEDTGNYAKKTRVVPLATGLSVFEGTLLVYQKDGYVLADNKTAETCENVVIAATDGITGTVGVIDVGVYNLSDSTHDGENCYVGEKGKIVFGAITTSGLYSKKIGFVEGSYLVFRPSQFTVYIK